MRTRLSAFNGPGAFCLAQPLQTEVDNARLPWSLPDLPFYPFEDAQEAYQAKSWTRRREQKCSEATDGKDKETTLFRNSSTRMYAQKRHTHNTPSFSTVDQIFDPTVRKGPLPPPPISMLSARQAEQVSWMEVSILIVNIEIWGMGGGRCKRVTHYRRTPKCNCRVKYRTHGREQRCVVCVSVRTCVWNCFGSDFFSLSLPPAASVTFSSRLLVHEFAW